MLLMGFLGEAFGVRLLGVVEFKAPLGAVAVSPGVEYSLIVGIENSLAGTFA